MNAIAELAQLLDAAQAWKAPPDVIFVAMGSGSTVLGVLLGIHLMGWNTKVVGVADQDKSLTGGWLTAARAFVRGNSIPHSVNGCKNPLPGISQTFFADATRPLCRTPPVEAGYGLMNPQTRTGEELKRGGPA
jgi:hypothetical protein